MEEEDDEELDLDENDGDVLRRIMKEYNHIIHRCMWGQCCHLCTANERNDRIK